MRSKSFWYKLENSVYHTIAQQVNKNYEQV